MESEKQFALVFGERHAFLQQSRFARDRNAFANKHLSQDVDKVARRIVNGDRVFIRAAAGGMLASDGDDVRVGIALKPDGGAGVRRRSPPANSESDVARLRVTDGRQRLSG